MSIEHLKVLVSKEFPFPIAYHFRRSMEEKDAREMSCHLLGSLLEFLGVVCVSDYLSGEARSAEVDAELARLPEGVLTGGRWQGLILRILENCARHDRPPLFPGLESLLDHSARRQLGRLVEARNDWAHRKAQFPLGSFRRNLMSLLGRIQSLHRTALVFVHSSRLVGPLHFHDATIFKGDNPNFASIECRSDGPLEANRLYLYSKDSREILSLHPLMTYARCQDCPAHHLFQFNKVDRRKLIYSALPDGHELRTGEALHELERMLAAGRAARSRPRHFSLPGEFAGIPRTHQRGSRIGPYRVEEVIKNAGITHVYRVVDSRDKNDYALKVLPVELACDPILLQRFDEEAAHLERLDHPHVVKLHDRGEDFGDRYLVLDLVPGGKVGSGICRDLAEAVKPLAEEEVIRIGKQVCEALDCIHQNGILHRDLKPGNLLVVGDRVLVGDFGISQSRTSRGLTLTGMSVGTPEYMSPEQIQDGETDPRSDLYSLGCVLYELATGRPPYRADAPLATMFCHLQAAPPAISDLNPRLSAGLANIIFKLLQKDPERRYGTARGLFRDLGRVAADPAGPQVIEGEMTPQDKQVAVVARERARYRRRLGLTGGAAALGLALIGLIVLGQAFYRSWKVESWVAHARTAWLEGPGRRTEALDLLDEAQRLDRDHRALQAVLGEMGSRGALTIRTGPPDLEMEAIPDEESAKQVKPVAAGSAPGRTTRFRSGERILLGVGHHRVSIFRPGKDGKDEVWVTALFFVGRVRYRQEAQGWREEHLPRLELDSPPPSGDSSPAFVLGEEILVKQLILPREVKPDQVYVNPGPFRRSPSAAERPPGQSLDNIHPTSLDLIRDELSNGFLMAQDETTIGEFARWFERRGRYFASWRAGLASKIPLTLGDIRKVPLETQKRCWDPLLARRGIDAGRLQTPEALLRAAFDADVKQGEGPWNDWVRRWEERLAKGPDPLLPVAVEKVTAIAYARTHAAIGREELVRWLERKEAKARAVEEGLERARAAVSAAGGETVDASVLPSEPLVRCRPGFGPEFSRQSILEAYGWWFHSGAQYACQLPCESILRWARQDRDPRRDLKEIDKIAEVLREPSRWLGNRLRIDFPPDRANEPDEKSLIDVYGKAIREARVGLDRAHLLGWIGERIEEEEEERRKLEALRGRLGGPTEQAEAEIEKLRFELRYEFGADQGWGIPTTAQWEKACRGPDGRAYPHGDTREAEDLAHVVEYGWVDRGETGAPLTINQVKITAYRDRSPHGVYTMAGNLSEWVVEEDQKRHFLKGGNFTAEGARFTHAGSLLSVESRSLPTAEGNLSWTGFRVVREIREWEGD